jgi:hypothetical protein
MQWVMIIRVMMINRVEEQTEDIHVLDARLPHKTDKALAAYLQSLDLKLGGGFI